MDKSPPQGGVRSEVRLGSPLRQTKSAKESAWWRSPPSKVRGGPKVRRRTSLADTRTFLAGVSASPRRSRSDPLGLRRKWRKSGGLPADSAADWRSPTRRNFGRTPSGSARSPAESEQVRSGPRRTKVRHGLCHRNKRISRLLVGLEISSFQNKLKPL